jgi:muconolactone D-isomerase
MSIRVPPELRDNEPSKVTRLYADEAVHCRALADKGMVKRLWRVPATTDNWGLWEADTPTALHEAISGFPLFPYMTVEVISLAENRNDPALRIPEPVQQAAKTGADWPPSVELLARNMFPHEYAAIDDDHPFPEHLYDAVRLRWDELMAKGRV